MMIGRALLGLTAACLIAGCSGSDQPGAGPDAGGDDVPADAGADAAVVLPDPPALNIGFNNGYAEQFDYFADFFGSGPQAAPRLCHAYVAWDVANQAPHTGDVADHASRAFMDDWLTHAQGHCEEAMISFKARAHGDPPSTSAFAAAFEKFAAADWAAETGFTGTFAFTPWNEANNPADSGNGLGVQIDARLAARYYLAAERSCRQHGCKVAAGDFASNGNMWDDFQANCADADGPPADLCKVKSATNTTNLPASYLDRYKNEIVARTAEFSLPPGFRPAYFAYHGWHDTNRYIDAADHCSSYATCTLRRVLTSLSGTWAGVEIWNSEDGVGQTSSPDDRAQACAAAFLLRVEGLSPRVTRLYITRLHSGPGQLLVGHAPRPAMTLLANRQTTYPAGACP